MQEYDTAGDYKEFRGEWLVNISQLPDWRHEFLVALHELVEMALTRHHRVDWKDIDQFDKEGEGKNHPDPGSLVNAPYHNQHKLAEQVEKRVAKMLDVDWNKYNEVLDALEWEE
jgi:hypothetical protein